jgi:acyl-homoserine lactone acylase PvdQ
VVLRAAAAALLTLAFGASAASAAAGSTLGFRDILPAGQGQNVNGAGLAEYESAGTTPATFTNQESMFERLLTDAPHMTPADLNADFKSAAITLAPGTGIPEASPEAGVTVTRDAFNVAHVVATTALGAAFGAGYVQAEDRLFEMDLLRHLGRADLAEFLGPSYLPMDEAVWAQSDYDTAELQGQLDALPQRFGAAGRTALQQENAYVAGINAYIQKVRADPLELPGEYAAIHQLPQPWTAADSVAIAAEINQGFDLGGGGEVQDAELLEDLRARLGRSAGTSVYGDLRAFDDSAAPTTTNRRFPFENPGRPIPAASALPAPGSVQPRNPVVGLSGAAADGASRSQSTGAAELLRSHLARPGGESFAYLVSARHTSSGHPVADMGPQLDFFSPELLDELTIQAPGIQVDGGALPGALPIPIAGHTDAFAWSITIGVGDHIDIFAERLCNPDGSPATRSSTDYIYRGRCIPLLIRDRQEQTEPNALDSSPPESFTLRTERSVHGPIQSTGTVAGHPVAFARDDSTYFHLVDTGVVLDELVDGTVHSPQSFVRTVRQADFSLNWFYIDSHHIAWSLSGLYPRRARGTNPDLPTWGTGAFDWQGFDPASWTERVMRASSLPHSIDPPAGFIANWNNKPAPGWRAASDDFYYSSAHRVQMVRSRITAAIAHRHKLDPARLAALVEDADTADIRGEEDLPLALRIIGRGGDAATGSLVKVLRAWVAGGAHRRDLNGDGIYDNSAAVALTDAWWPLLVAGIFEPTLGPTAYGQAVDILALDDPPDVDAEAYYNGWYGQVAQDLLDILASAPPRAGEHRLRPLGHLSRLYCGGTLREHASLSRCRTVLIATLKEAAASVASRFGTSDAAAWKVPSTCPVPGSGVPACDEIVFSPLGAVGTNPIPWQNRPTFQQIVEISG